MLNDILLVKMRSQLTIFISVFAIDANQMNEWTNKRTEVNESEH